MNKTQENKSKRARNNSEDSDVDTEFLNYKSKKPCLDFEKVVDEAPFFNPVRDLSNDKKKIHEDDIMKVLWAMFETIIMQEFDNTEEKGYWSEDFFRIIQCHINRVKKPLEKKLEKCLPAFVWKDGLWKDIGTNMAVLLDVYLQKKRDLISKIYNDYNCFPVYPDEDWPFGQDYFCLITQYDWRTTPSCYYHTPFFQEYIKKPTQAWAKEKEKKRFYLLAEPLYDTDDERVIKEDMRHENKNINEF